MLTKKIITTISIFSVFILIVVVVFLSYVNYSPADRLSSGRNGIVNEIKSQNKTIRGQEQIAKGNDRFTEEYLSKIIESYYMEMVNLNYEASYAYEFQPEENLKREVYNILQLRSPQIKSFSIISIHLDIDDVGQIARVKMQIKATSKEGYATNGEIDDLWILKDSKWYHVFQ